MILDETLFSPKIYHITGDIMWYEKDNTIIFVDSTYDKDDTSA